MKTLKFTISGKPIAKARHRMARGFSYDPQSKIKKKHKALIAQIMRERNLKPLQGSICANLVIHYPLPKSWSKKKRKELLGQFVTTKPDNDNYEKFYFDVMNEIAYKDDALISRNFCEKVYSNNPSVEIELYSLEENKMVNEHALTFKEFLSIDDLNYLVKKANKLGLTSRNIVRVYQEEDSEGKHLYFEVEAMKGIKEENKD